MSKESPDKGKVIDLDAARQKRALEAFRAEHGRDPDFIDELEKNPQAPVERIASALDYYRFVSAQILAQLAVAEKHGVSVDAGKLNGLLDKFRLNGVYTEALTHMQSDLGELNFGLYDQIKGKVPDDELEAETERTLTRLAEEGKQIREDSF